MKQDFFTSPLFRISENTESKRKHPPPPIRVVELPEPGRRRGPHGGTPRSRAPPPARAPAPSCQPPGRRPAPSSLRSPAPRVGRKDAPTARGLLPDSAALRPAGGRAAGDGRALTSRPLSDRTRTDCAPKYLSKSSFSSAVSSAGRCLTRRVRSPRGGESEAELWHPLDIGSGCSGAAICPGDAAAGTPSPEAAGRH